MDIDLPDGLARATPADWRQLADITAEAFAEDPVNKWIFGTQPAIRASFRALARDIYARDGICHLAGDAGATMWLGTEQQGNSSSLAMVRFAIGQLIHGGVGSLKRAMAAGDIMAEHHPREPIVICSPSGPAKVHGALVLVRRCWRQCSRRVMPAAFLAIWKIATRPITASTLIMDLSGVRFLPVVKAVRRLKLCGANRVKWSICRNGLTQI